MTITENRSDLLTEEMLARFDTRAPEHDRANTFFHEDFEELRASGYLTASISGAVRRYTESATR